MISVDCFCIEAIDDFTNSVCSLTHSTRALHIRNTAHPLAVLEHRGFWHARRPGGAFRITLKHPTAQAASVGTLRTAARNIARPKT
jgi:hypothetical protein